MMLLAAPRQNRSPNTVTNPKTNIDPGLFTTTLDFGVGSFGDTARWLEIAVATNGSRDFIVLDPRQAEGQSDIMQDRVSCL